MKNIYFFSGLGADERVFQYVDLSFCNPIFIKWNLPFENESIENYALRLSEQIILISSAKTKYEIPPYYQFAGAINAHKIIPTAFVQKLKTINYFLFGVSSTKEKELLNNIIQDTNPEFLNWAIDKIVNWENEIIPENTIHIHGNADRILPIRFVKPDYTINKAGHFMIVQNAKEIDAIISNNI